MLIWIMGDSWATPNYFSPMPGWRAKNHVSELLADAGHTIYNFGINGAPNIRSFEECTRHGEEFIGRPELVIWFHTSVLRDYHTLDTCCDMERTDCSYQQLDKGAELVYPIIKDILHSKGDPALIVIEGHGKFVQPHFDKNFKPHHVVHNWRGQIVGLPDLNPPFVSEAGYLEGVQSLSEAELEQLVDDIEQMQNTMSHELFPDYSHPGDIPHQQLAQDLLPIIHGIEKQTAST